MAKELSGEGSPFSVAVAITRMPMIFIDANSPDNEIIYANAQFLEMIGSERSVVVGMRFRSTFAVNQKWDLPVLSDFAAEDPRKVVTVRCVRLNLEEFDATLLIFPI